MTMGYLRRLRDASVEAPQAILPPQLSFGLTIEQQLFHQTQVYLVDESVRYYDQKLARITPHAAVQSGRYGSNTVDPERFWMLALGNDAGKPQAMGQGDFARWLQDVALTWWDKGDARKAEYYLGLSQAAFRAFLVRHEMGGVRNNKTNYHCYKDQDCFWFHSGNREVAWPQSVLNKNLNAIRNILWAYRDLVAWRDAIAPASRPAWCPPKAYFRQLHDLARGGLNQLAHGTRGPKDRSKPPSLRDFLQNNQQDPDDPAIPRYNSYYWFDMHEVKPGNGGTDGNVCHYHYYSLQLFKQILEAIASEPYSSEPDFVALHNRLLYGATRRCDAPGATYMEKRVRNHPLAELYYGGLVYRSTAATSTKLESSSFPEGHCKEAPWFQSPAKFESNPPAGEEDDVKSAVATRRFFAGAYRGCIF